MSSKKKNAITMIALVVVLIICLVLYFVIPRGKSSDKDADSSSTSESNSTDSGSDNAKITLDTITSDNISSITLTKKGKQAWKLSQKKKGTWKIDGKESAPVSDDTISSMVKNVNPVKATQKFSAKSGNLSDYGLKTPAFTIAIETKDGASYQYQIGSEVPKSDMGYYAKCSGHDEIYCLNTAMITAFNVDEISFIKRDTLPEIDDDYLTAFSVKNKKGNDFAAKKVTDAEKVDFYSNWNITAPYAKPLATSQSEWSSVLGYFTVLKYEKMVEYDCKNLKKYGLDSPTSAITVDFYQPKDGYTPTATATPNAMVSDSSSSSSSSDASYIIPENKRMYKSLNLLIGKKTKDSYYVCEKGSRNVYTMSSDTIEKITKLDAYTNMDHCVYSVLATSIKGYDVTYGNTTLSVTRKTVKKDTSKTTATPTAAATESGTAVNNATDSSVKNIWTLNGKKISDDDERDFLSPYSLAYLLEYSGKADNKVKPKSSKPVLTIVYHENNRDVTVRYLPYDGINFYRVEKNGMDYFLVDKLSVDDIIKKFKGIEKLAK